MSSISSYGNKYHIKIAAPPVGKGGEILLGKIFYWVMEIWREVILTIQIFFGATIKISKTCVYKEE